MDSPLSRVCDVVLPSVIEQSLPPLASAMPFGSPPRVVQVKAVLSPTKKGKIAGPTSPVKPKPSKPQVGVKRRVFDFDEDAVVKTQENTRYAILSTAFRVQLPSGEWLCFAAQMELSGGGLDEMSRPTKRRLLNSLPGMCEGMRLSGVKLCLVGAAVDRVSRPHGVEVANVLDFFKSLRVDPDSQCTILSFHNATWTESGLGFCSVLGDQLRVRAKEEPLKVLVQQTVTELKAFQQDAHCILTYSMGPLRTDEQDQLIGILFDRQRVADRVAAEISLASGMPRIDYSCAPSPHTLDGHECTGARVVVYNRLLKRREGHGLVCVDTNKCTLSVYVEYENEPYNFAKFKHRISHEQRAHYQRTSSGFITLGGNEYALTVDRTNGVEAEDLLWRLIQQCLQTQADKARKFGGVMSMWKQREAAAAAKRAAEQKEAELAAAKKKAAREMERAEAELAAQKARLQQQQQQAKLNGGKENTSKQQQPQLATRDRERLDSATEAMQLLEKTGVLASAASASSQAKQQQGGSDSRRSALENALERLNSLILGF